MNSLGSRLTQARNKTGLTQSEVAHKLRVSAQAVSLWERDENAPDIMKLPELASLYNVTTDWLLSGGVPDNDILSVTGELSDRLFDEERMYTFVKTYCTSKEMYQTVKVLPYVREKHAGQVRKGKDRIPYINHPLLMACHAISLGFDDDDLISAILLHDVAEDCGVAVEDLPVNEETKAAVELVTKDFGHHVNKEADEREYYARISENRLAMIVKLIDRCNNVSGMAGCFSDTKLASYIKETETYIYPLFAKCKEKYPEYSKQLFLIKYHMTSVVETIRQELAKKVI